MTTVQHFASDIDAWAYGSAQSSQTYAALKPFSGRISDRGIGPYHADVGRYHLYGSWSCPRTQRCAITIQLCGLDDVISVSFVDGMRDGRGWAFRERTGVDPINGFTLIREAYEASRPGYLGDASIPLIWDRERGEVVTNVAYDMDRDLATVFSKVALFDIELYPKTSRAEIDLSARQCDSMWANMGGAVVDVARKDIVRDELRALDARLAVSRYLVRDALSLADVRLWVLLLRYDAGINAHGRAGPSLRELPNLWEYARRLYAVPAFCGTTDFASFCAPPAPAISWSAMWSYVPD